MASHVVDHVADMVFQLSSLPPQAATAEPPQAATAEAPLRKKPKRAATAEALLKVKEEPENLNWDGADYGGTTDDEEPPSHEPEGTTIDKIDWKNKKGGIPSKLGVRWVWVGLKCSRTVLVETADEKHEIQLLGQPNTISD